MTATVAAPRDATTPRRRRPRRSVVPTLLATGLVGVLGLLLALPTDFLGARPVLVLVLMGLPVLALTRRIGWREPTSLRPILLSMGLVLLGLVLLGLALNTFLPWLGLSRPLGRPAVGIAVTLATIGLLWWRSAEPLTSRRELRSLQRSVALARFEPATTVGVLSVLAAVAGAIRLNNSAGSVLALIGHLLVVSALGLLLLRAGTERRDGVAVYLSGLSLLLATSLRGWYVIGHDIQQEYAVYLLTQRADHWTVPARPTAYDACLSLNVLPTTLANLTGLSGAAVFKVVVPLLFALVPVAVYAVARAFVGRRPAVLASALFIGFPTFANDMPYLVRQEIAFIFVVLGVLVALHRDLSRRSRQALAIAFGVGVVLTHYSTTYVMLIGLAVGVAGLALERHVVKRRDRREPARVQGSNLGEWRRPVLAAPVTLAALALCTWAWVGPATHSGGHLADTVASTTHSLLRGDLGLGSSDLGYGIFAREQASPQERLDLYAKDQRAARAKAAGPWLVQSPTRADSHPEVVAPANAPLTPVGRALHLAGVPVAATNALFRLGSAALIQLWLVVGIVLIVLRRRAVRAVPREGAWLAVGSLGAIGLLVALPGLSADYGVLRAVQQSLIVTAPIVVIGAIWSCRWLGRRGTTFVAGAVLLIVLILTGALSTLTGGFPGVLALANSGQYYDQYYDEPQEQAGVAWVAKTLPAQARPSALTAEPSIVERLAIAGRGRMQTSWEFFPLQLRRRQWLFLDSANVTKHQSATFYTGNVLTYRYPVQQMRSLLDVVYSSPQAQVLR